MNSKYSSRLVFFALFFSVLQLNAQFQIADEIDWKAPIQGENGQFSPDFDAAAYNLTQPSIPKYCESVKINNATDFDARLVNISYMALAPGEMEAVSSLSLKETPELETYLGETRYGNHATVCFFPFVKQGGVIKKVRSFEIEVTPVISSMANQRAGKKRATAANSVLNSNGWFKISVGQTGLHKITPGFLSDNGIAAAGFPVSNLRIVGNGIGMLPEKNSEPRPDDLLDVPLQVFDVNNDGLFNGSDYAVFFAKGPHQWRYDTANNIYNHIINVYRSKNYYFISTENGPGKNIPQMPAIAPPPTVQTSTYDDYAFHEDEDNNLVGTGRIWFGDMFDFDLDNGYAFNFPNIDKTQPVRLRVNAVARASSGNTFMSVSINNQVLQTIDFSKVDNHEYSPYVARSDETTNFQYNFSSDAFTVRLQYNNSLNPSAVAWLDFIEVQLRRKLINNGDPLYFRDISVVGPSQVAEYAISNNAPGLKVWNVTDHNSVMAMSTTTANGITTFKDNADKLKEYVAFSGNNFPEPEFVQAVSPQNLHGLSAVEMIIVTHPKFLSAAQRLADFHINNDNISTHVVTTEQIYNEFGSGGQDISAIRDFNKMMYEKAIANNSEFNYLLLFGDASYDYKDRLTNNNNYVPIWESRESLSLNNSSITDDFYGLLDPEEGGNGTIDSLTGQYLEIGIGRIPCETTSQAESAVNKIIRYTTGEQRFGDWRNRILMLADDVGDTWETMFVTRSEQFEDIINNASEAYNVDKIYLDAYNQVSTTGGQSYPEAHDDMYRKVQQGNLITNYIGHGGEIGLTSEKLLGLNDVNSWTNIDAMPLFMTITCEFTRLDDPKRVSAGEQLALNPNGGAVALISTTRVVNGPNAINLNEAIFKIILERPNNQPKTLGSIIRDSKNALAGDHTRLKFSLIGDPAVKLSIPYYRMQVNTVNGKSVAQGDLDTLKALSKIKVTGQVNDFSNQKLANFTGVVDVSVYDKESQRKTLVNDGIGSPIPFSVRNNLMYKGKVEVVNGDFQFEFIVPKDISYNMGYGKFSLYATNGTTDAAGYFDTIYAGGYNDNAEIDNEGPTVQLYINDENFVRGGITDENPELYAIIADSSGINTVGNSVGHDLVAILDQNDANTHVINEYYEADLNSYQQGSVRYPLYDLEEGQHTLKLKVFDVHNNYSQAETEFIVADSEEMALKRVLNYPNPFTTHTEFQFEHNRVDQPLEVQVQIFTVSGKLVKTINRLVVSQGNRVTGVSWNGLDDYGDKIGKGVYVYRVKVKSQLDNSQADKYEKLVILR